ncbi:hypothetical protein F5887DRAFT_502268 [Amanita rubescens]|nr:hypothetical protein F5887DRAFT_502268 [Amanita rubescens]
MGVFQIQSGGHPRKALNSCQREAREPGPFLVEKQITWWRSFQDHRRSQCIYVEKIECTWVKHEERGAKKGIQLPLLPSSSSSCTCSSSGTFSSTARSSCSGIPPTTAASFIGADSASLTESTDLFLIWIVMPVGELTDFNELIESTDERLIGGAVALTGGEATGPMDDLLASPPDLTELIESTDKRLADALAGGEPTSTSSDIEPLLIGGGANGLIAPILAILSAIRFLLVSTSSTSSSSSGCCCSGSSTTVTSRAVSS